MEQVEHVEFQSGVEDNLLWLWYTKTRSWKLALSIVAEEKENTADPLLTSLLVTPQKEREALNRERAMDGIYARTTRGYMPVAYPRPTGRSRKWHLPAREGCSCPSCKEARMK